MVPLIWLVREVYIRRIQLSAETFLLEAEARGREAQRWKVLVLISFKSNSFLLWLFFSSDFKTQILHLLTGRYTATLLVLDWVFGRYWL